MMIRNVINAFIIYVRESKNDIILLFLGVWLFEEKKKHIICTL